jgi:hypothetical protein
MAHILFGPQISVAVRTRTVVFAVITVCLAGTNVSEEYIAAVFRVEILSTVSKPRNLQHVFRY